MCAHHDVLCLVILTIKNSAQNCAELLLLYCQSTMYKKSLDCYPSRYRLVPKATLES